MFHSCTRADDAEVPNILIALLSQSFRAFADAALHAGAFLARWLGFEQFRQFFEPGYLLFGFHQMSGKSFFQVGRS
jgi:hypothetical protein